MSFKSPDQERWYAECIEPHEPMIRHWLASRYGMGPEVDDILQEALLRMFKAREKGEIRAPKAFFYAVARNLAVDRIRKGKMVATRSGFDDDEAMALLDEGVDVGETAARNHELEILTQAIQSLPKRCRQVFTLSKVYGMAYKEIAEEMGISMNTVSAQITIGLSKCSDYMLRYGRD